MPRLKLTLAYKGARYCGWQLQEEERPNAPRSIQGLVEEALAGILKTGIRVHGASRTDAGVHAEGQVAHLDVPERAHPIDWQLAINAKLPKDIAVVAAEEVAPDFHARFDAKSKIYTYSLWLTRRYVLPQRRAFVWATGELDLEAMDRAAQYLVGEHDFASFQNQGSQAKSTVREVLAVERDVAGATGRHAQEGVWRFAAKGFLKQMVRNCMGCLVAVGKGRLKPEDIPVILAAKKREAAAETAPAWGLTLKQIFYDVAAARPK